MRTIGNILRAAAEALRRWLRTGSHAAGHAVAGPDYRLENLGRLHLSPSHSLHLVRAPGKTMVIAVHPGGCVLLDAAPWQPAQDPAVCGRKEAQHAG